MCGVIAIATGGCASGPAQETWATGGLGSASASGAAAVSGWYAVADTTQDAVQVRDVRGAIVHEIDRDDIAALMPWASFDTGADGPVALASTDAGRAIFILIGDDTLVFGGESDDAVLRLDTHTGQLDLFARFSLVRDLGADPPPAAAFFRGRVYIGTSDGQVITLTAGRNDRTGTILSTTTLPVSGGVTGVTVDRDRGFLFVSSTSGLYRAALDDVPLTFQRLTDRSTIASIAYSDQYGAPGQDGLFLLNRDGGGNGSVTIERAAPSAVRSLPALFESEAYYTPAGACVDLSATACGRLLAACGDQATMIADTQDDRLGFEAWVVDEFEQVTTHVAALVHPDGWVFDNSPVAGQGQIEPPASPDAALWAIALAAMNDHLFGDPGAEQTVERILTRYAGLAPDGIGPATSADGFLEHWIDPETGGVLDGWPQEYATYSTMKIVAGADRGRHAYPGNAAIERAAHQIVCDVHQWAAYFDESLALYLISEADGGPIAPGPSNTAFVEGILFADQAGIFGGPESDPIRRDWLDRSLWPSNEYLTGRPFSTSVPGVFQPAFITIYPLLFIREFRDDPAWLAHSEHTLDSFAAWTDDNGPRYYTAFSAGGGLNGYHADTIFSHPGTIAHFPAVMGFAALGRTDVAVGAYHAYRLGARTMMGTGASVLARRSQEQVDFPIGIGLPDLVYGALGLGELIEPGVIDAVLAPPYAAALCRGDLDADSDVDTEDAYLWEQSPVDTEGDALVTDADRAALLDLARDDERTPAP
ncbi:MAG: hypothetical protein AAGI30_03415 [Planctomycetota bacterium]